MSMIRHRYGIVIALLLLLCGNASAEIRLEGNELLLGSWLLKSVAPSLDKKRIPENRTWEFRSDGTIVVSGYNRHFHRNDTVTIKYHVEDGKMLAEQPGRPGKYMSYSVYEKSDKGMILKGGMEGFYFFDKN